VTEPLKLFFDECLSKRLPTRLIELYLEDYPHLETTHLTNRYASGTKDSEWIPMLAKEDWILVTADAGKSRQEKLPILCAEFEITHIIISSTILKSRYMRHKEAFYCLWPQIAQVPLLPKGTRISFRLHHYKHTTLPRLEIDKKPFAKWCDENDITFE